MNVRRRLFAAAPVFAVLPLQALAQAVAPREIARVSGFRSARFGMGDAEVRAAVARDFPQAAGNLRFVDNPKENTRLLVLSLASLEPAPGAASVSYIFGAATRRLMHVNVTWTVGTELAVREQLAVAAVQLGRYFGERDWAVWRPGLREDGDALVVFSGVDRQRASVEVRLTGVPVVARAEDPAPAPRGPAVLRVAYAANAFQPDVAPIPAKAF